MKLYQAIVFLLLLNVSISYSQQAALEIGVFAGTSFYKGEIDAAPLLDHVNYYPAGGLQIRCQMSPHLAMRSSIFTGTIGDEDINSELPELYYRNLSFRSRITEAALTFEFDILKFQPLLNKNFTPYVFGGTALLHFNPKTLYEGDWIELQPLGTEGQGTVTFPDRKPYARNVLSIPFGFGMKIAVSPEVNITAEFGWRVAVSDYLDDVSKTYVDRAVFGDENGNLSYALSNRITHVNNSVWIGDTLRVRGDGKTNDWYYFSGITCSYRWKSSNKSLRDLLTSRRTICPEF